MTMIEIAFEDLLNATPTFEPPTASCDVWPIGQPVAVKSLKAFVSGERRFDFWTGFGVIDMIAYGGDYVRICNHPYTAWISKERLSSVTLLQPDSSPLWQGESRD